MKETKWKWCAEFDMHNIIVIIIIVIIIIVIIIIVIIIIIIIIRAKYIAELVLE